MRGALREQECHGADAQNAGPGVPPLVSRVPWLVVLLLGLHGDCAPSLASGRTTTGERRRI